MMNHVAVYLVLFNLALCLTKLIRTSERALFAWRLSLHDSARHCHSCHDTALHTSKHINTWWLRIAKASLIVLWAVKRQAHRSVMRFPIERLNVAIW